MPCSGEMDERVLRMKRGSRSLDREFLSTLIKKQEGAVICYRCNETQRLGVEPRASSVETWCGLTVVCDGGLSASTVVRDAGSPSVRLASFPRCWLPDFHANREVYR